jgi:hypothetical protein
MELCCLYDVHDLHADLVPDANVIAELKRLRAEEGYEIQILDVSGEVARDLLLDEECR